MVSLNFSFKPNLAMTVLALLTVGLCVKAGLWQLNKASLKQALQVQLSTRQTEQPVEINNIHADNIKNLDELRYKRVKLSGVYDTRYQVLVDNQVENTVAGYHVITPLKLSDSQLYVLINRGWIPRSNAQIDGLFVPPVVENPDGLQRIEGDITLPSAKFFTLESPATNSAGWQTVWQNLDLTRYVKSVPFTVQPYIVRLSANNAGGFTRNWPPPGDRVRMHLGYAYQWFGFAMTLLVIYVVLNVKRK